MPNVKIELRMLVALFDSFVTWPAKTIEFDMDSVTLKCFCLQSVGPSARVQYFMELAFSNRLALFHASHTLLQDAALYAGNLLIQVHVLVIKKSLP